jgi:hypothetical protein
LLHPHVTVTGIAGSWWEGSLAEGIRVAARSSDATSPSLVTAAGVLSGYHNMMTKKTSMNAPIA